MPKTESKLRFKVERLSPQCIQVLIPFDVDRRQSFMLSSDHHWDNPHCDRDMLKRDLDRAIKENMGIFSFGDLFCAMQGKGDRRHSKGDLREEHKKGNYLDSLVSTSAEWYSPYASNFIALSDGNHETAITKHHETDLTERLCESLGYVGGHRPEKMGYTGWVFFSFIRKDNGKTAKTIKLNFSHGYGGGGPVTKGVIQVNRKSIYLPDADICVGGHIHEKWYFPIMRERISVFGNVSVDEQVHISLPTYKEEYLNGSGFHREKGRPPKPLGCWFVHFDPLHTKATRNIEVSFEMSNKLSY